MLHVLLVCQLYPDERRRIYKNDALMVLFRACMKSFFCIEVNLKSKLKIQLSLQLLSLSLSLSCFLQFTLINERNQLFNFFYLLLIWPSPFTEIFLFTHYFYLFIGSGESGQINLFILRKWVTYILGEERKFFAVGQIKLKTILKTHLI